MATSPNSTTSTATSTASDRVALRIELRSDPVPGDLDGAWWPQSRDLQVEAADLVDNVPGESLRIQRLLFSRPDWDDAVVDGRGTRRIHARRGPVKVGSFPSDDTHLMILAMAAGHRLRLLVVPSDSAPRDARREMQAMVS
jgi:hypothetical protein